MANEKQMDSELIEELQQRLEALNNEGVMDAGVIDGFLTAYALNPEHPSKHDIYPYIFSEEGDPAALPEDDRILELLAVQFGGRPVGLTTLASALSEDPDTLEDVYEPFLMQQGLMVRTPKGRVATERAYDHLGIPMPPT